MANATKAALAIVVALAGMIVISGLYISGRGFSAKEEPTVLETWIAGRLRDFATPRAAREMQNPVAASETVLAEAMTHFADHCASCHGNDGSGDTPIGNGLYPKPPDMRRDETQQRTDGELFYIIYNGVRLTGMPAFGGDKSPEEDVDSWKLVHFIRHLPRITTDELARMKTLNPKSPHQLEEEEAIRRFLAGEDIEIPPSSHSHD